VFPIGDRQGELMESADQAHRRWNSNFSKPFQGKSKVFQGNCKLFQAFSKDFQTFSLAVSNEISGLAATPAISPFSQPPRRNSPRAQSALGERRAIAQRSSAAAGAEALADLRLQATTNSVFPEGKCRDAPASPQPQGPPGARAICAKAAASPKRR
jgi:hypothetical protein